MGLMIPIAMIMVPILPFYLIYYRIVEFFEGFGFSNIFNTDNSVDGE